MNNPPGILLVDDEPGILFVLTHTFQDNEYVVETASNGTEAIEKLRKNTYYVVVLDLNMQPVTGIEVLKELRSLNQETVVIILTAHSTVGSAIEALRLGAFDYLVKPAEPEAIRQRVSEGIKRYDQALNRAKLHDQLSTLQQTLQILNPGSPPRPPASVPGHLIHHGELSIDLDHHRVRFSNRDLDLTTTEYKLLVCLVESAPKPVTPCNLVQTALGYETNSAEAGETIKYHIHHLRQKIEPDPMKPIYIKTIRYEGYMWSG